MSQHTFTGWLVSRLYGLHIEMTLQAILTDVFFQLDRGVRTCTHFPDKLYEIF